MIRERALKVVLVIVGLIFSATAYPVVQMHLDETLQMMLSLYVTLGIFLLVINGVMILIASAIVPGFHVYGLVPAFWGAVVLALLGMLIRAIVKD